ncbi:MAG: ornithine carbamoyltransferase [Acidobacteria bacterium]|nr:ornithine carbamoyltransferase [Acidobacteriota bacterium]
MIGQINRVAAPHLATDLDLTTEEVVTLLDLAGRVKRSPRRYSHALAGRYLALLFEKPSLRTRMTFELAIKQLGGDAVFTEYKDQKIGDREPIQDVARNLERWVQGIVARTYEQQTIEELARWAAIPVINALSDLYHPCQALADFFTLQERFGALPGLKAAFVGDGNNVAHSLMLNAARLGVDMAVAAPEGFQPNPEIVSTARGLAEASGCSLLLTSDPLEAVEDAHAVYTDVWASMGREKEARARRRAFASHQVTSKLMAAARPEAVFMHCLPAHRGEEVAAEVIESPASIVFDQAENRLHAQKALLLMMLS